MKIGIFGGSFDPIHIGHLILAEEAFLQAGLDQILFMPAKVSPFKQNQEMASEFHRLEMIKLAIKGNDKFQFSDYEFRGQDVSYTIHTLRGLKKLLGEEHNLYFIMGTDAFLDIEKWYCSKELLMEFSFIIGSRPGYKEDLLMNIIYSLKNKYPCDLIKIRNRHIEISSSGLKQSWKECRSIQYLVPKEVEEYIIAQKLYR